MTEQFDVMVVAAHPDDAEFGVAGTVAKWTKEGKKVVYVICTSGDKGTSDRGLSPEKLAVTRKEEQLAAAKLIGVNDVVFLGYPDQGLEDTPSLRKEIVRVIRQYRPFLVVTSDPYRRYIWHRDHRIIGQVTLDAVFPFARDHLAYPDLLDEGLEPHKVKEMMFWGADEPNYRSDITDTFDLKMNALQCHQSQISHMEPSAFRGRLRKRYEDFAAGESFTLAEAFHHLEIPY